MHYEYERPITQASNNLLRLGEKVKEPNQYIDEICEGFFDAYTFCLDNKKLILNYVSIFENIEVRHLVQDTQRYSMLLHTSYNPDFLQDAKDRQLFLCAVLKKCGTDAREYGNCKTGNKGYAEYGYSIFL